MLASLFTLGMLAVSAPAAPPDSTAARHVVRQFEPVLVVGGRMHDARSVETVQRIAPAALRTLPVDRFSDAVGLQAGVVATGQDLHVRGGRAGELAFSIDGLVLNEPLHGKPPELPLFAVNGADLMTGGLDADHAGSLAGELDAQMVTPTEQPAWRMRWLSDGRRGTGYDALNAGATGPLAGGLGYACAVSGSFDDLGLPALRTRGRSWVLGQSFGWREDNHMQAWLELAPVHSPGRAKLQVLATRTLEQPYDPAFSFDGWVTPAPDPTSSAGTNQRMIAGPDSINATSYRYRAADHLVMTEENRLVSLLSLAGGGPTGRQSLALGWLRTTSLTSVGLRRDHAYVNGGNLPLWGPYDYNYADPFHVYGGDDPYWQAAGSERWQARGDIDRELPGRQRVRIGAGVQYDHVWLDEYDLGPPPMQNAASERHYIAWAPGGWAYVQHRWDYEGLTWNAGVRMQYFTPGPQASQPVRMFHDDPTTPLPVPHWVTYSPRLGFSYPVSDRDVFALAYTRIDQDPERDYLYDDRYLNFDRDPHGNTQLQPSEVIAYQGSVRHLFDPAWSMQASLFSRDLYGQIGARYVSVSSSAVRWEYTNDDYAHATGFELALLRERAGRSRFELAYTWMTATGTQSNESGLAFGMAVGGRPVPIGEHPLDWDQRHSLSLTGDFAATRTLHVSFSTHVTTGRPWTPFLRDTLQSAWLAQYPDLSQLNNAHLPLRENTNLAVRWTPRWLRGAIALVEVTNLFDQRVDVVSTVSGYPNTMINTLYDEYDAFRSETGLGGGAYWNSDGTGGRHWVRVGDARLASTPRSVRVGLELGR